MWCQYSNIIASYQRQSHRCSKSPLLSDFIIIINVAACYPARDLVQQGRYAYITKIRGVFFWRRRYNGNIHHDDTYIHTTPGSHCLLLLHMCRGAAVAVSHGRKIDYIDRSDAWSGRLWIRYIYHTSDMILSGADWFSFIVGQPRMHAERRNHKSRDGFESDRDKVRTCIRVPPPPPPPL